MSAPGLVEHFFRHEYSRLVAALVRRVGLQNLEIVEDAVQSALMTALESWKRTGPPERPSAWVYQVAKNALLDALRTQAGRQRLLEARATELAPQAEPEAAPRLAGEVQDDLLRMMFNCCDEAIPEASQVVLTLKLLCGFEIAEIAQRLFTSEANVYKRHSRARTQLRARARLHGELNAEDYGARRPAVLRVLYLLFTEGYLSVHAEAPIRRELCEEAIRLTTILAEHPLGRAPEAFALLALMHLHAARLDAREDGAGGLLLLQEQDRALWKQDRIQLGLTWLARSAQGATFSRYHAEAGVAAEHCLAPSFEQTRWDRVAQCYALLEQTAPSALHRLNRAVAVAECQGAAEGLRLLQEAQPPSWLEGSYLWAAVRSDLHRRCGHTELAARLRAQAIESAPTEAVRTLLKRRLG